jgi:uncharacterized damage-inducible protein DinB
MLEQMLGELRQESATTRRLLERVPDDKLDWRPHPKSMTLGQLALHVANIPGAVTGLVSQDEFDAANANFNPPGATSLAELLTALDASLAGAEAYLTATSNDHAMKTFRLTNRGQEVFALPRAGVLRSIMLNHLYHHRGQLTVYLRTLDVQIPVIYGRSADENPFA